MSPGAPRRRGHRLVQQLHQVAAALERPFAPAAARPPPRSGDANRSSPYSRRTRASSGHRVGVEHVGRGRPAPRVHPHVEVGVAGVGEAPLVGVELQRRDAEVEQDAVDPRKPQLREHVGDLVVDGVDEVRAVGVGGEPSPGERERLRVPVQPDERELRVLGEERGRVAAEPQRGVHHDRGPPGQRRTQQLDDPRQGDGDVPSPSRPISVRVLPHSHPPPCPESPSHPRPTHSSGLVRCPLPADLAPGKVRQGRREETPAGSSSLSPSGLTSARAAPPPAPWRRCLRGRPGSAAMPARPRSRRA